MAMQPLAQQGFSEEEVRRILHAPNREIAFRYELLDGENRTKKAALQGVLSASVANNALAQIKRTARFRIYDGLDDIDYLRDRIRPWVRVRGERARRTLVWLEWPQGVFLLSSPRRTSDEAGGVVRDVEAYDQLVILQDDKVTDRYTVKAGTNYIDAVRILLDSAGIKQRNLVPSKATLPVDRDWPPGTSKLEIINDLLAAINYRSLTFDAMGAAVAEPYVSPADAEPEYRYVTDGESVIAPEATEEMDLFNVANRWVLVVSEPDQEPLVAVYSNDNPESPTSTVNRGRVIVDFREYEEAANLDTLEARAQRIAFEASQVIQAIEWESWIMPHHGDSDVYELVLSQLGVAAKYSEHTWEMDLEPGGTMRHRARRVVPI